MQEFAAAGIEGARTEAIARLAGVNKALIYYYFKDKETLHRAVLDNVFSGLKSTIEAALAVEQPPRQKLLTYVSAHFDYIVSSRLKPQLFMREMLREGASLEHVTESYLTPVFHSVVRIIRDGIASGDFRPVDPMQFVSSIVAVIVFYFSSAPVVRILSGSDPLEAKRVAARRAAVLDMISAALFVEPGTQESRR